MRDFVFSGGEKTKPNKAKFKRKAYAIRHKALKMIIDY